MTTTDHILVVDDDADIREGVCRWLGAAGFSTRTADDGSSGIESVARHAPQAIVLDMMMPRKDGIETLSELRSNGSSADIPVVMLSASLRDEQRALDAGARFFIQKPFDGQKLVVAVRHALNRTKTS